MYLFEITSGNFFKDSELIGKGYSGHGIGKSNPHWVDVHEAGPIPPGRWRIGKPRDTQTHGPYVLPLTPEPETDTHGRGSFLIHGDSLHSPGTASLGCIILARDVREQIGENLATDDLLIVTSGLDTPTAVT